MSNEYDIKGKLNEDGEMYFTDGLRSRYEESDMLPVENLLVSLLKCKFLTVKSLLEKMKISFTYVEGEGTCYLTTEKPRRIYKIIMNIYFDKSQISEEKIASLSDLSSRYCVVEQSVNGSIDIESSYHLK